MQHTRTAGLTFLLALACGTPAMAQTFTVSGGGSAVTATGTASGTAKASDTPPPAQTVIDDAVKTAKAEHKTVFVHVGASWCGWCHKLEAMLHSTEVGPVIATYYVLAPLDALENADKKSLENPGVDAVMKSLDFKGGPPMFAFLDADGKKIASSFALAPNNDNIGYPGSPTEIQTFGELLKKTAPKMTDADWTKIMDYLHKNAPKQ